VRIIQSGRARPGESEDGMIEQSEKKEHKGSEKGGKGKRHTHVGILLKQGGKEFRIALRVSLKKAVTHTSACPAKLTRDAKTYNNNSLTRKPCQKREKTKKACSLTRIQSERLAVLVQNVAEYVVNLRR